MSAQGIRLEDVVQQDPGETGQADDVSGERAGAAAGRAIGAAS